jgi:hypothetical protein
VLHAQALSLRLTPAPDDLAAPGRGPAETLGFSVLHAVGTHPATVQLQDCVTSQGVRAMSLSWISNRSLRISPRARLVDDGEAEALRRKLEQIEWRPQNGFLRDQVAERSSITVAGSRAA